MNEKRFERGLGSIPEFDPGSNSASQQANEEIPSNESSTHELSREEFNQTVDILKADWYIRKSDAQSVKSGYDHLQNAFDLLRNTGDKGRLRRVGQLAVENRQLRLAVKSFEAAGDADALRNIGDSALEDGYFITAHKAYQALGEKIPVDAAIACGDKALTFDNTVQPEQVPRDKVFWEYENAVEAFKYAGASDKLEAIGKTILGDLEQEKGQHHRTLVDAGRAFQAAGATEKVTRLTQRAIDMHELAAASVIASNSGSQELIDQVAAVKTAERVAEHIKSAEEDIEKAFVTGRVDSLIGRAIRSYDEAKATDKLREIAKISVQLGQLRNARFAYRAAGEEMSPDDLVECGDAIMTYGRTVRLKLPGGFERIVRRDPFEVDKHTTGDGLRERVKDAIMAYEAAGATDKLVDAVLNPYNENKTPLMNVINKYKSTGNKEKLIELGDRLMGDGKLIYKWRAFASDAYGAAEATEKLIAAGEQFHSEELLTFALDAYEKAGSAAPKEKVIAVGRTAIAAGKLRPAIRAFEIAGEAIPPEEILAIADNAREYDVDKIIAEAVRHGARA